jgi:signal peptidase I
MILGFTAIFLAGLPGFVSGCAALFLLVAWVIWLVGMMCSSWHPIPRFGFPRWILLIIFIVGFNLCVTQPLVTAFKTWCVSAYAVSAMSMAPTLIAPPQTPMYFQPDDLPQEQPSTKVADHFVANHWIYRFRTPKRGELVLFKTDHVQPDVPPTIYVKRVVGLPGETVDIQAPYVMINGEKLTDPPIFQVMASRQAGYSGYMSLADLKQEHFGESVSLPLTLGPDEYFLLGDNSPRSKDSRFYGPVSQQDIIGRAIRIHYPFSRMRELE